MNEVALLKIYVAAAQTGNPHIHAEGDQYGTTIPNNDGSQFGGCNKKAKNA